jgi:hypothetical protein
MTGNKLALRQKALAILKTAFLFICGPGVSETTPPW